jgi:hypothetical protein
LTPAAGKCQIPALETARGEVFAEPWSVSAREEAQMQRATSAHWLAFEQMVRRLGVLRMEDARLLETEPRDASDPVRRLPVRQ